MDGFVWSKASMPRGMCLCSSVASPQEQAGEWTEGAALGQFTPHHILH